MRSGSRDHRAWAPGGEPGPVRDQAWVVDFDAPLQPSNPVPRVVLARARLDNAASLASSLSLPPNSSVEPLLLAAYMRWGPSCPDRLIGDFAFAIWDPGRRLLIAARDPFGVEPLFCWASRRRAAIAFRIVPLFQVPGVRRSVQEAHILRVLGGDLESTPEATAFDNIQRVRQGHFAVIERDGIRQERYWKPEEAPDVRLQDARDYSRGLWELLAGAVRCRMPQGSTIGAFLSGGLDSSTVAVLARDESKTRGTGPLRTFTLVFDSLPEVDERQFANSVLATGGFDPGFVRGDLVNPFAELGRLQGAQHEPLCLPNLHLHDAVYAAAAAGGVQVLLDGFDGDTAVSHGISWLGELAGTGRVLRAFSESLALTWRSRAPLHRLLAYHVIPAALPPSARRWARALWGRADEGLARPATERAAHEARLGRPLIGLALEGARAAADMHGVEPRYPFFDRRLVEFCLGVPPDQKLARGWTRWILRRAGQGALPRAVQWRRTKSDLTPALHARLRASAAAVRVALAEASHDLAFADSSRWQSTLSNALRDESGSRAVSIWRILAVAEWLRLHAPLPKETAP